MQLLQLAKFPGINIQNCSFTAAMVRFGKEIPTGTIPSLQKVN